MKVALYSRVSIDKNEDDGRFQNPENQLVPLREYCKARNFEIIEEYTDKTSGGSSNRPNFQRMLSKVRQGHIKIIIVWALDRFSREGIVNTLSYIKQLKKYNCALISLQESWLDTSDEGVGMLLLSIMSWVAEQERKKISERTKAGLRRLKEKGIKLGRPKKKKTPIK